MREGGGSSPSVSPSADSCATDKVADFAARTGEEIHRDSHSENTLSVRRGAWESDAEGLSGLEDNHADGNCEVEAGGQEEGDGEEEFEFAFVSKDENSWPISADEIFYNGQIRPLYPIFDPSLWVDHGNSFGSGSSRLTSTSREMGPHRRRPFLEKLLLEEQGTGSSSSSASDLNDFELEGAEPGTYCIWNPKPATARDPSCKKSKSTGTSSKRWKLRDLLLRSQSDRKDSVFLVSHDPSKRTQLPLSSPCKASHVETKEVGNDQTRRKLLPPRRPDIVGLLHNVNEIVGRNLHPF